MPSFPLVALLLATPTPAPVAAEAFTRLQALVGQLRHLELEATDADHTTRREVYVENGEDDSAELKLVRVKQGPG